MTTHTHSTDPDRGPCDTCSHEWDDARTLEDLGALAARWLNGDIEWAPAYGAPTPDAETTELIPTLTTLNRAGYFTEQSQPGIPENTPGGTQRAFTTGLASEELANIIAGATTSTDLITLLTPPGSDGLPMGIPVTRDGTTEYTWIGITEPPRDTYSDTLTPTAVAALDNAWHVHVLDPVWGRNTLLWPTLEHAVTHRTPRRWAPYALEDFPTAGIIADD